MKIVVGCDGYNAKKVAEHLKKVWPVNAEETYSTALKLGFGDNDCLTIITESEIYFKGDDEIHPRYREIFQQPKFNPRWECGAADHAIVINVPEI